jgi:hypothetical protein
MRSIQRIAAAYRSQRSALIREHAQPGDLITHATCGAGLQEHYFVSFDGNVVIGRPTQLTSRFAQTAMTDEAIGPGNVTHINRTEIDAYAFVSDACKAHFASLREKIVQRWSTRRH